MGITEPSKAHPRPPFAMRAGLESDFGFVAKSWSGTGRAALDLRRDSPEALKWGAISHGLIELILKTAQVRIIGPPDDATTIYGFCVLAHDFVHCVYVKESLRRLGYARELLSGTGQSLACPAGEEDFEAWASEQLPLVKWVNGEDMDKARRVVSLVTRDGGIDFASAQGTKNVTHVKAGPEIGGLTAMPATEMELDTALGGVVVRYKLRGQLASFLVPMSHIRQMELG